jgi:hypothetical protein
MMAASGPSYPVRGIKLVRCKGTMRVPDNALRAIVYLGYRSKGVPFQAVGTGFIIGRERPNGESAWYLITADHVAKKLEKLKPTFAVRLNDTNGTARDISPSVSTRHLAKWWRHPTNKTVDAAVFPWHAPAGHFPYTSFPVERFVTEENQKRTLIGVGDDIYIVGLFPKWAGKTRISPIVRRGHIAMMAGEPIATKNYGDARLHFVEAMIQKGLSGSPVFVEETLSIPLNQETPDDPPCLFGLGETYLLGLVHGFMPIKVAEELTGAPGNQMWNTGICQVVPSEQILEILNQVAILEYEAKFFEEQSKKASERH